MPSGKKSQQNFPNLSLLKVGLVCGLITVCKHLPSEKKISLIDKGRRANGWKRESKRFGWDIRTSFSGYYLLGFLILITNEISHRNKPQQKNFLFSISRFPQLLWKVYNTICSVLTHAQQNSAHQWIDKFS